MDEPDEMQLTKAMRTTGAVRAFRSDEVPDRTVYEILDDARFAPSGGNRQGWHVVVVRDPELRVAIRDLYVLGWREYMAHVRRGKVPFAPGSSGSYEGPAVDLTEARRTPSPSDFSDHLDAVPVMLIVLVELGALAVLDNGLARQSIVGGGSIYPFTHNILLAARARGLGGVMTTVICREERAVKELLGVPEGFAVAGLLALGVPEHQVSRLSRKPVEAFTTLDSFGGAPLEP